MKTKVWVETPFGDFEYVPTDFTKGFSSCALCAANGLGVCNELCCDVFDNEGTSYHFERRTK